MILVLTATTLTAQEVEILRPPPPRLEDFETDADGDAIPDGWYNLRDVTLAGGGVVGPHCLKFVNPRPGRPARISRAFGMDGKNVEAVVIGLWYRASGISRGERLGEEPGLMLDFLGDELRSTGRGSLGPWKSTDGTGWNHVAKRISVPPSTNDAILSIGLLGATGTLEVDGLTIDLVPVAGTPSTNLILNGDLELGDPDPPQWSLEDDCRRISEGHESNASLMLGRAGAKGLIGLSAPVTGISALDVSMFVKASNLRGSGGAVAEVYFLDDDGRPLPGSLGGVRPFRFSGSFGWRVANSKVRVPRPAVRAVFQVEKLDNGGTLQLDDLKITAAPDPEAAVWQPYEIQRDTETWKPYAATESIEPNSALDASAWLDAPAGGKGRVVIQKGRFHFENGERARFFGVALLPPAAFQDAARADALADRLARSGVNLVRFGGLDVPLGPARCLIDDTKDDTKSLDPAALALFDHLIAALRSRGIYYAIELNTGRLFRDADGIPGGGSLPLGGGPAASFDPTAKELLKKTAIDFLTHKNAETGLALIDDPALVCVTLKGESSLFDLLDDPDQLPTALTLSLRELAKESKLGSGRRFWTALESEALKDEADALRKAGLKAPIAGSSHWRRETEFNAVQAATGLDFIDDRLYWTPSQWINPDRRSMISEPSTSLSIPAGKKRRADRPYVVGQWASHTFGAWALPFETADLLCGTRTAMVEDWDVLVRRGVFREPEVWGVGPAGTSGGPDIFRAPEVINANPAVFAFLPHAASIFRRADVSELHRASDADSFTKGRIAIDTPFTSALAGWSEGRPAKFTIFTIEPRSTYVAVAVSSMDRNPIERSKRLLVSMIGRIAPTGMAWNDNWKRGVADPGHPPLKLEPVQASIAWRGKNSITVYPLDNSGKRLAPLELAGGAGDIRINLDSSAGTIHWEILVP
jgi:hypothetical protein